MHLEHRICRNNVVPALGVKAGGPSKILGCIANIRRAFARRRSLK